MSIAQVRVANDHPLYNIGVVMRVTGIAIATLRAWERRYGFPHSGRTQGGHRLYSEADIERLRWVKAQIDHGMQTAQAIRALQFRDATERLGEQAAAPAGAAVDVSPAGNVYCDRLLAALLRNDTAGADALLGEALPVLQPEGLILDVIGPAMAAIGDAWFEQRIGVATEHLATNYLRQRLLIWMVTGPPALNTAPLLLGCAPGELHEGGLLMLGALLRRRRWPVAYLGQMVPLADMAALVRQIAPPLVVMVAMSEDTASALAGWPQWLPEAVQGARPVMTFAGRVFTEQPDWRRRVPGVFLGASVTEGVAKAEDLLR